MWFPKIKFNLFKIILVRYKTKKPILTYSKSKKSTNPKIVSDPFETGKNPKKKVLKNCFYNCQILER